MCEESDALISQSQKYVHMLVDIVEQLDEFPIEGPLAVRTFHHSQ